MTKQTIADIETLLEAFWETYDGWGAPQKEIDAANRIAAEFHIVTPHDKARRAAKGNDEAAATGAADRQV